MLSPSATSRPSPGSSRMSFEPGIHSPGSYAEARSIPTASIDSRLLDWHQAAIGEDRGEIGGQANEDYPHAEQPPVRPKRERRQPDGRRQDDTQRRYPTSRTRSRQTGRRAAPPPGMRSGRVGWSSARRSPETRRDDGGRCSPGRSQETDGGSAEPADRAKTPRTGHPDVLLTKGARFSGPMHTVLLTARRPGS